MSRSRGTRIELRVAVIKAAEHCLLMKELERERNLLHALMDNLPDAIWFKDNASRLTQVNKAAAAMLDAGDPSAVPWEKLFSNFFHREQAREIQAQEQKIIRTGRADTNQVQELRFNGNGTRWMSTTRAPVLERTGGVAAIVGVSTGHHGTKAGRTGTAAERAEVPANGGNGCGGRLDFR